MKYWEDAFSDEQAAEYMKTYGEGPGAETRLLLASFIKPEEWVLDVGCGPGWNFDHFQEFGPSVYYRGIDYSKRFIKVASERVKPMNIFKVGDVRDIQEPDKSFDVVILQDVLEHTNDYKKPVTDALRIARRLIIVTFWHMIEDQEAEHVNDDGDDTWGAWWARPNWEKFLNSLNVEWSHKQITDNKPRDFYTIEVNQ